MAFKTSKKIEIALVLFKARPLHELCSLFSFGLCFLMLNMHAVAAMHPSTNFKLKLFVFFRVSLFKFCFNLGQPVACRGQLVKGTGL